MLLRQSRRMLLLLRQSPLHSAQKFQCHVHTFYKPFQRHMHTPLSNASTPSTEPMHSD